MGVPQFFSFLIRRYGTVGIRRRRIRQSQSITQTEIPGRVSSLAFDMNGFFYKAAAIVYAEYEEYNPKTGRRQVMSDYKQRKRRQRLAREEKENPGKLRRDLFNTIFNEIKKIIMAVNPQDTVIFAVDGMAPLAKIQQQRQRRYKSAKEKKGAFFDTNSFSPGTELMMELDEFLRETIKIEIEAGKRGQGLFHDIKTVIYSGHLDPGEGEHKIMQYYRDGLPEGPISKQGGAHIIHGLDSDLIMLSMLMPQENVFLMREDVEDILNVQNLKTAVQQDLGTSTAIDDFLVIMYLIGNDFLPRVKSLSNIFYSLDKCLDLYKRIRKPLTENGGLNINWEGLAHYLHTLKRQEPDFLQEMADGNGALESPSRIIANSTDYGKLNFGNFRSNWYTYALSIPTHSADLVKSFGLPEELLKTDKQEILNMGIQFLTGMAWTSLYYRKGMSAINTQWSYPYFYAPLLTDLSAVTVSVFKNTRNIENYKKFKGMLDYNVIHQLLCIIPPASNTLVPEEVLPFYYSQSPIIDLFPENFKLDKDGKAQEWMMHALVPHANIKRVYVTTEFVEFPITKLRSYGSDSPFIYSKRGYNPRNTIIETKRNSKQVQREINIPSQTLYDEERKFDIKRSKSLFLKKSEVDLVEDVIYIKPKSTIDITDFNIKPYTVREKKGRIRQIRFKPKGRIRKPPQDTSKTEISKIKTTKDILNDFNLDYDKFPLNLDI